MAEKTLNVRIALRRDLEANYVGSSVPLKGELCFVDTTDGLRIKLGDGSSTFSNLEYVGIQEIVVRGYYHAGKFYSKSTYVAADEIPGDASKIYFENSSKLLYVY